MSEGNRPRKRGDRQAADVTGPGAITVNAERLTKFRSDFVDSIQQINQHWLKRTQSEAALATEFALKMASTRTLPDATAVWQEWASRRVKIATEAVNCALATG